MKRKPSPLREAAKLRNIQKYIDDLAARGAISNAAAAAARLLQRAPKTADEWERFWQSFTDVELQAVADDE